MVDCDLTAADAAHLMPIVHAVHAVAADHAVAAEHAVHAGVAKTRKGMRGPARLGSIGGQLAMQLEVHQQRRWRCPRQTEKGTVVLTCRHLRHRCSLVCVASILHTDLFCLLVNLTYAWMIK